MISFPFFSTVNTNNTSPSYTSFQNYSPGTTMLPLSGISSPHIIGLELSGINSLPGLNNPFGKPIIYSSDSTKVFRLNGFDPLSVYSPMNHYPNPTHQQIDKLVLAWKLQQNLQAELLKSQIGNTQEIKKSLLNSPNPNPIYSPTLMTRSPVISSDDTIILRGPAQLPFKNNLKNQIQEIISFILDNFGRADEKCFEEEKAKYSQNKDLMAVFDILISKYSSTTKTKEEMIKYTLRKALKSIKSKLKRETKNNRKKLSKALCNNYFSVSQDEISEVGNEEEYLKQFLPFRKNSKNKTINNSFVSQVFSSKDFCLDYENFLQEFDLILETDNNSKLRNFVDYIEESIHLSRLDDIKKYKTIPWLKLWITNTIKIARDLPNIGSQPLQYSKGSQKKIKVKDVSAYETIDSAGVSTECDSETYTESN